MRQKFVNEISAKALSKNVVATHRRSAAELIESIVNENGSLTWKLKCVDEIVALKNP